MAHGSQTIPTDQGDLHVLNNGDGSVDIDIAPTNPEKLCIYVNGEPWGPIQPTAKPEEAIDRLIAAFGD